MRSSPHPQGPAALEDATIQRWREVIQVWNWLPAFRAVAETENLNKAAKLLHVTPSALSRSIHLLEDSVGRPLFGRSGRHLALNDAGKELLTAVRGAMRHLHDGVTAVKAATATFHLGCSMALEPFVAGILIPKLVASFPHLVPALRICGESEIAGALLRGHVDIAFTCAARRAAGTSVASLGPLSVGVYCGRGHPLFDALQVSLTELSAHSFIHVAGSEEGAPTLPPEVPTQVGLVVPSALAAIAACAAGVGLFVAFEPIPSSGMGQGLRRLSLEPFAACKLYAMTRVPEGTSVWPGRAVEAMRGLIGSKAT
jgi:DNA-binding transcriptional LysR family regulator